ncbi:MAG: hypothetical protein GKR97_07715 [Rhizobiaceae bacterium]|nr:hypothetical protein [Rhizobiaceae bacterium]
MVAKDDSGGCFAKFDYSASELSCVAGEILAKIQSSHGWTWCQNGQGGAGWVPDMNLKPL